MQKLVAANKLKEIPEALKKGSVHRGYISNVMPYGVFVQFGRYSGLCHFTNVPSKFDRSELHKGLMVEVSILEILPENKLSLSLTEIVPARKHEIIVTRDAQQYSEAISKLRKRDLQAAQEVRRMHAMIVKKEAVKLNALVVQPPRTVADLKALGIRPSKKKINVRTTKTTTSNKNQSNKKVKRRSVWTISGGGFETNRRKH